MQVEGLRILHVQSVDARALQGGLNMFQQDGCKAICDPKVEWKKGCYEKCKLLPKVQAESEMSHMMLVMHRDCSHGPHTRSKIC